MRFVAWVIIVGGCLGLSGCALTGKKKDNASQQPSTPAPAFPTSKPAKPAAAPFTTTGNAKQTPPGAAGMLAGRVINSYDRTPPPTYIQVVSLSDKSGDGKSVNEVATDNLGYFTIQGLQPGQHYELVARTREGEHRLAGRTMAIAPNPRVLIYISEDLATGSTPPAPSTGRKQTDSSGEGSANKTSSTMGSGSRGAELGSPVRIPGSGSRQEIAAASALSIQGSEIPLNINSGPRPGSEPPRPPSSYSQPSLAPSVTARVPSCVLSAKEQSGNLLGSHLDNFALYDLNGQPWEYRNHRGKLVLIDFWGTWCTHCMPALAHLRTLHNTYAGYGLEVIGIAYEQTGSPAEQVHRVQAMRDEKRLPYQVLMGSDMQTCPVLTQFRVKGFPSLVLLDENSRIIWTAQGLRARDAEQLETIIRQHLLPRS